jgi:hypothetical protein
MCRHAVEPVRPIRRPRVRLRPRPCAIRKGLGGLWFDSSPKGPTNRVVRPSFIKFLARRAWQRFLGKLLLARAEESNTVGIVVALNAVNGNAAASYASLRKHDSAVFVIEGKDLLARTIESGEVGKEDAVRETVTNEFRKESSRLEPGFGYCSPQTDHVATGNSQNHP